MAFKNPFGQLRLARIPQCLNPKILNLKLLKMGVCFGDPQQGIREFFKVAPIKSYVHHPCGGDPEVSIQSLYSPSSFMAPHFETFPYGDYWGLS